MNRAQRFAFEVPPEGGGQRLDQLLAAHVPDLSRRRARLLIDLGGVFIDGRRMKMAGRPMKAGEKVVVHIGGALQTATKQLGQEARAADEARLPRFKIVFEDEEIVVVDKPAGLLTAPTPESDRSNLQGLLERRSERGRERIFVVHRIDLQTSGLLVFAKTEEANRALAERFRTHDLDREYLAVVAGAFPSRIKRIDARVGGRVARTFVRVEERFGAVATLVRCRLETGRTHQIRIHARGVGHPVLGDAQYGPPEEPPVAPRASARATTSPRATTSARAMAAPERHGERLPVPPRMALHAARLGFAHPTTGEPLAFESPWPVDLSRWLDALRQAASRTETPPSTAGAKDE